MRCISAGVAGISVGVGTGYFYVIFIEVVSFMAKTFAAARYSTAYLTVNIACRLTVVFIIIPVQA